ncbi:acetate--CoA ligase family protein [Natrarchaeobius chitinivorans]|uniref:acetate--CoA ligase (ADP-forming) n=1 Tax=Natrarchaeobius chitinivorans TaxID=1679083 RepID=A0A3N6LW64_NATCH|nr:CoA-binding protein [Natrarchaeobius chitinivorans]RQG94828.1 CoA-binding protein [Natrarchaeobius chitinivorans]
MSLSRLFEPESIAVIGASADEGKIGYAAMDNIRSFDGRVYPVNPSTGELFGHRCYDAIDEVDDRVDLALSCVPRQVTPAVVEECGEADVGGVVVYAAGFSEHTEEGSELEAEIVATAREHDLAVLGPNTSGFINANDGVIASFVSDTDAVPAGNVAVVAQSGGINHVLMFMAENNRVGISKAIGLGNAADTDFAEVITYLDADDDTESILLHVEGTDDARALLETCRGVETPVSIYKVGREDVTDFAASHTGSMVGDYQLYEAGCAQYGVPMVDSCQELLDVGNAFASLPEPDGSNVALVTGQAGPGIAITDRLKRAGTTLPSLSERTCETIDDILPGLTYTSNPVDTGQPPDPAAYETLLGAIAEDEAVDILLVYQLYEERVEYPVDILEGLVEDTGVPAVFATTGPSDAVDDAVERFHSAGIPAFQSPERGAEAVNALATYAEMKTDSPTVTTAGSER